MSDTHTYNYGHWEYYTLHSITDYLDDLMTETIRQCEEGTPQQSLSVPEPLCSGYQRPDMAAAVSEHRSRFILKQLKTLFVHINNLKKTISLNYRSRDGYLNPAYCSDGNFFLIAITAQLGNTTRTFFPSHPQHKPVS